MSRSHHSAASDQKQKLKHSYGKAKVGEVSEIIAQMCADYGEEVRALISYISPEVAKETVKQIKNNIESQGIGHGKSGKYAKGWTSETYKTPLGDTKAIVYNADAPGLPHLLEYDHAMRQGGRSTPRAHIKPAEEWAEGEIVRRIMGGLK